MTTPRTFALARATALIMLARALLWAARLVMDADEAFERASKSD